MVRLTWAFAVLALLASVALPAVPAEGQGVVTSFSGTANGVDRENRLGVRIVGRFTPTVAVGPAFPCRTSATLFDVISDGVSDVAPVDGFGDIPLLLSPSSGTSCLYEFPFAPPFVRLLVGDVGDGVNSFNFRLTVTQATYEPSPIACTSGKVTLLTRFRLSGFPAAINVQKTADWDCFGVNNRFLETP